MDCKGWLFGDYINTDVQKNLQAVMGEAQQSCVNVDFWARNLTDAKYATFAFRSAATGQAVYSAQRGMPFQMGVDVKIHF